MGLLICVVEGSRGSISLTALSRTSTSSTPRTKQAGFVHTYIELVIKFRTPSTLSSPLMSIPGWFGSALGMRVPPLTWCMDPGLPLLA